MHLPDMRATLVTALRQTGSDMVPTTLVTALRAAELYWVSADMMRVALDASADLPDWTPASILPAPQGLIAWQEPLPTLPYDGLPEADWPTGPLGTKVAPTLPVDAVAWSQYGGAVHLWALSRTAHHTELLTRTWGEHAVIAEGPARAGLWPITGVQPIPSTDLVTDYNGTAGGLVAAVGATWALMNQPTVASARQVTPKGRAARDARRAGRPAPVVSLIDLRPLRVLHEDPDDTTDAHVYRHRWIVRGHWKSQPYGPGRALRRPTWVASYIKGPDGAPLLTTEHVHVWRR